MNARRLSIVLACATALVGCQVQGPTKPVASESSVKTKKEGQTGQLNLTSREIRLLARDGSPLNGVAVQIGGKSYLVRNGVVTLDEAVLTEAKKAGKLVVIGAGFLPLTLTLRDDAPTEIVMTATVGLGKPGLVGAGGGTIAAAGDKALVTIPADFLTGTTKTAITVGTYRPTLGEDAQAAFDKDVTALLDVRSKLVAAGSPGSTAAPAGGCAAPLACGPVTGGLGVSLTVDGPVKGGQVMVSVDLAKMTDAEDVAAAKRITDTFAAFDASGDPTWRQAMKDAHGITLDGTVLNFPVKLGDVNAVDGVAAVEVDGLGVLGTRLEVTVITAVSGADVGALKDAVPILPGDIPAALINARLPGYSDAPGLKDANGNVVVPDNGPDAIFTKIESGGGRLTDTGEGGGVVAQLTAAQLLTNNAGAMIDQSTGQLRIVDGEARSGTNLISNNIAGLAGGSTAGLIANNSGGLLSNNAGSFISNNAAGIVADNGAGVISNNAGGIISQNGSGILSDNGSQLTGFPYFPFSPPGVKYELFQIGVPTPGYTRETPTGLMEYLWPGQTRVRAIGADGTPLTDWVKTVGGGGFTLPMPKTMPIVFFLQAEIIPKDEDGKIRRAYALAFAPGKKQSSMVAVDASTTMVATSTMHLIEYIPPEYARLDALAASYEEVAEDLEGDKKPGDPNSNPDRPPTGGAGGTGGDEEPSPEEQVAAALDAIAARTGELAGAWGAFNPYRYGADLGAADRVVTKDQAEAVCKATALRACYDPMYGLATAGQFRPGSLRAINPDSPPIPPAETVDTSGGG